MLGLAEINTIFFHGPFLIFIIFQVNFVDFRNLNIVQFSHFVLENYSLREFFFRTNAFIYANSIDLFKMISLILVLLNLSLNSSHINFKFSINFKLDGLLRILEKLILF